MYALRLARWRTGIEHSPAKVSGLVEPRGLIRLLAASIPGPQTADQTTEEPKMRLGNSAAWLVAGAMLLGIPALGRAGDAAGRVDFNRQIRPILSESCYQCHGPDQNKRKANLRLDLRDGLFRSADGTTVVVPGKPDESELVERITSDDPELRMPPREERSATDRGADRADQAMGCRRGGVEGALGLLSAGPAQGPESKADRPAAGQIDRFVRAGLATAGLEPAAPADGRTLVRRLSFDLIGLPPTPSEVDDFENDKAGLAYEHLVDRLLASPRFGERMAIFWLDLVRYADTTGYHGDNHVDIYLFRDYVIRAFNANKPFDRFTIEQLAGDLLPCADGRNADCLGLQPAASNHPGRGRTSQGIHGQVFG